MTQTEWFLVWAFSIFSFGMSGYYAIHVFHYWLVNFFEE